MSNARVPRDAGPIEDLEGGAKLMNSLTERRAAFVYNGARLAAIAAKAPIVPVPWDDREESFRSQFLTVIERQCGPERKNSPEELHEDWVKAYLAMGWKHGETYNREARTHPDMVPYGQLGQLERDKDAVFVALCEIARQWIYDFMAPDDTAEGVAAHQALREIVGYRQV